MFSGVDRRVTDEQTDRRTSCDGKVRAMHMRRAVKCVSKEVKISVVSRVLNCMKKANILLLQPV